MPGPLSYRFWHSPAPETDPDGYERDLAEFHRLLNEQGLAGLLGSLSHRLEGATWLEANGPVYEDCYIVEGSEVLDPLNDLAVSARLKQAHDRPALAAEAGAGGLYRLLGGPVAPAVDWATWLTKPRHMPYPELYRQLSRWTTGPDVCLWRRQMVLGPAPEFCILAPEPAPLADELSPIHVRRQEVFRPRSGRLSEGE